MIVPDEKDWTWVLEHRCPECGFDATACGAAEVPALARANAEAWQELFLQGAIRAGRPDPSTWSSLEYACHVRDVYRRYRDRIQLMLERDDPLFENWDQDSTAVNDRYDEQDPASALADLLAAAEAIARQLEHVRDTEWMRPGRRGDGASFTVDTISRYMIHDPIHHLWDVSGSG